MLAPLNTINDVDQPWLFWQSLVVGLAGFAAGVLFLAWFLSRAVAGSKAIVVSEAAALMVSSAVLLVMRPSTLKRFLESIGWSYALRPLLACAIGGLCGVLLLRFILTGQVHVELKTLWTSRLLLWSLLSVVFVQPLVEELYFRGVLFVGVANAIGERWGIGVVTVIFVLLHVQHRWIVLPISIVLGAVRLLTRSVSNCFALHATYNLGILLWGIR